MKITSAICQEVGDAADKFLAGYAGLHNPHQAEIAKLAFASGCHFILTNHKQHEPEVEVEVVMTTSSPGAYESIDDMMPEVESPEQAAFQRQLLANLKRLKK